MPPFALSLDGWYCYLAVDHCSKNTGVLNKISRKGKERIDYGVHGYEGLKHCLSHTSNLLAIKGLQNCTASKGSRKVERITWGARVANFISIEGH